MTKKDTKPLATIGDLFKPKKRVKTQKPKRYHTKGKAGLDRFSPGTRVRCWWLNQKVIDPSLHGAIGIVCTEKNAFGPVGPGGRRKYVVIPKAEKQTRTVPDEVAFQVTEMVDKKIREQTGVLFLTEEEYTLFTVMES